MDTGVPRDETPKLELVGSPGTPFDALLSAAESDPAIAEGFALAYASMERDDRLRLLATIIADARDAGRSPAGPLALILAVEDDASLAEDIARALRETGDASLGPAADDAGWIWGSDKAGGVAVARSLHGGFVEVRRVAWEDGELHVYQEPLARSDEVLEMRRRNGVPDEALRVGLDQAVTYLAEVLWHTRLVRGSLPSQLRGFADLF